MKPLNHYYTLLFRHSPDVHKIRRLGGVVYHVGKYNTMIGAMISTRKQLDHILRDPNLLKAEVDCRVTLPMPTVSRIIPYDAFPMGTQATLVSSAKQRLTWNIARVLGGKEWPNQGQGIKVGVIDTGIDLKHPDLRANIKGGINFLRPSSPPQDDNGHGTHVAGIIAASNNERGVVGVAPACSLYAIKVLNQHGSGTLTTLLKGIEWGIQNKMDILNISISMGRHTPVMIKEAIKSAVRRGILVVASAGNNGRPRGDGDTVEAPARIQEAMAVAALTRTNKRAPFSATGPAIDIAAPGVQILSTYKGNQYAVLSGTSMAAPHVSGAAAIFKRKYPHMSPRHLAHWLQSKAIDLPPKGKDPLTGFGLVSIG